MSTLRLHFMPPVMSESMRMHTAGTSLVFTTLVPLRKRSKANQKSDGRPCVLEQDLIESMHASKFRREKETFASDSRRLYWRRRLLFVPPCQPFLTLFQSFKRLLIFCQPCTQEFCPVQSAINTWQLAFSKGLPFI